MSRIGRKPIPVPAGVDVSFSEANFATVKGPKGTLQQQLPPMIAFEKDGAVINAKRQNDSKEHRSQHGLARTLLDNMIVGVTTGFNKQLEVNGVGYRAAMQGKQLVLNVGYSHQVFIDPPEGLAIEVAGNKITVSGSDKQKVGQLAAEIREKRPPEPYKGKGIKYAGEVIRRKEGKTGGKKK
ncbi:MAG: 50S ribosomal protein L6 [Oscillospiraceae bacterium]|jgi:large subunit ribosomal protein L6|nr:50S ribosomal protein L6 [Oscillospiraceae bacterium]